MVVFVTFIEGGMFACVFLGLIECVWKKMLLSCMTLIFTLKDWELDFNKFLGFRSNGASMMVGSKTKVAT